MRQAAKTDRVLPLQQVKKNITTIKLEYHVDPVNKPKAKKKKKLDSK